MKFHKRHVVFGALFVVLALLLVVRADTVDTYRNVRLPGFERRIASCGEAVINTPAHETYPVRFSSIGYPFKISDGSLCAGSPDKLASSLDSVTAAGVAAVVTVGLYFAYGTVRKRRGRHGK